MIEYTLPFPPTDNNLYINARGKRPRVRSPEYRAWIERAGWKLKSQQPKPLGVRAFIQIDLDERRKGDCSNRTKALLDLLVTHGVLEDDSKKYVRRVSVGWEKVRECRVILCEATA